MARRGAARASSEFRQSAFEARLPAPPTAARGRQAIRPTRAPRRTRGTDHRPALRATYARRETAVASRGVLQGKQAIPRVAFFLPASSDPGCRRAETASEGWGALQAHAASSSGPCAGSVAWRPPHRRARLVDGLGRGAGRARARGRSVGDRPAEVSSYRDPGASSALPEGVGTSSGGPRLLRGRLRRSWWPATGRPSGVHRGVARPCVAAGAP